jgi:hypothetical protein
MNKYKIIISCALAMTCVSIWNLQAEYKSTKPAMSSAQKKLNSINCAKVLAQRNIIETVYGIKLKFDEEVNNILDGNFAGTTETKTGMRKIKGIVFSTTYDPKTDIAMVTASLEMSKIEDLMDKTKINFDVLKDKEISRTAFATSTPDNAKKIAALRAAEVDAYKNLYKEICGFTLESHTKVKNFVLQSDKVKASVIGAIMGAEFAGYKWEGQGANAIAVVKMQMNTKELNQILGSKIIDYDKDIITAEGFASIGISNKSQNKPKTLHKKINTDVIEKDLNVLP